MGKYFLMPTAVVIQCFNCENVNITTNSKYWHKKKTSMYSHKCSSIPPSVALSRVATLTMSFNLSRLVTLAA